MEMEREFKLANNSRIFKFIHQNHLDYVLFDIDLTDMDSFRKDLTEKRKNGYSLVILNSDLMSNIIKNVLSVSGIIHEIVVSDPTATEELNEEIQLFISGLRKNPTQYESLLNGIKWLLNEDSIFIDKISFTIKSENDSFINSELFVNGLLNGEENNYIFNKIILPAMKES